MVDDMINANLRITIDGAAKELGVRHERAQKMLSPEFFLEGFLKLIKRYGKCPNVLGIDEGISSHHAPKHVVPERWYSSTFFDCGVEHQTPRSPNFDPLEFFLCGYLKSLVYETPEAAVKTVS
ncbi:hypothetical protein TNCV_316951 [Trichonephila clavipes]|nr:hypothetical protein TNCV_316951 [Trichonephila clavipes]